MAASDPFDILGVAPSATSDEITQAYRAKARTAHPDTGGTTEEFSRLYNAYEAAKAAKAKDSAGGESASDGEPEIDPLTVVRAYVNERKLKFDFTGQIQYSDTSDELHGEETFESIVDDIFLCLRKDPALIVVDGEQRLVTPLPVGTIKAALRKIVRDDGHERFRAVFGPLVLRPTQNDVASAEPIWRGLAEAAFDLEISLATALLKKFVYDVKRRALRKPVKNHVMILIQSRGQGTGKTTFVDKFLGPLEELRSKPVRLIEFVDNRSFDLFRFHALVLDDIERLRPEHVPVFNALITGEGVNRRRLGTSQARQTHLRGAVIATSNSAPDEIVPDVDGNRRIAWMPFRSGNESRGGDVRVWKAINETDYARLWRSVDVTADDPIDPHIKALATYQEAYRWRSPLESWLMDMAPTLLSMTARTGSIAARDLHALWGKSGDRMSIVAFGRELSGLLDRGRAFPLTERIRAAAGIRYGVVP